MHRHYSLVAAVLLGSLCSLPAQWQTESFAMKAGWNAIYPFVDASDVTLTALTDARIEEVWRWNPGALDALAIDSPSSPVQGDEWSRFRRGFPIDSSFDQLLPNFGYLVKVANGTAPFSLSIKGKVVMPRVEWRNDGLNLVGFPAAPGGGTIGAYLSPTGLVDAQTEIFRYIGGPLINNPVELLNPVFQPLPRGEAMWINTGRFSDYYGPVAVEVSLSPDGLSFGETGTSRQLILRNRTDRTLTVTLTPGTSESNRAGASVSPVTLLQRVFDAQSQSYTYPGLGASVDVELAAGETVSKVILVDRAGLTGAPGTVNASVLRVTNNEGLGRIDVPVSATVAGPGGLWIGEALINQVQNQLQQFERDEDGNYLYDEDGARTPLAGTGDNALHATAQTFPIRLIVHVDAGGSARLLSKVYAGLIATEVEGQDPVFGVATDQSLLDADGLASATRITAVHFPLDLNLPLAGAPGPGGSLAGSIGLPHNAKDNPFIHAFHPDHDNLDARFENALPAGDESHQVTRALNLSFDAASPDGNPAWGAQLFTGTYREDITGLHKNQLSVEGAFYLRRLSRDEELHSPTVNP